MRSVPPTAALVLTLGCGLLEDPEEGTPPPINESANASQGDGFLPGTTAGEGTTGGSDSGTTADSTSGADSTGTGLDLGDGVLLVGEISIGDGAWTPPFTCGVRFFTEDQLNPMTGAADEWVDQYDITIDRVLYALMVTRDDVSEDIDFGFEGYVGVRCDTDGDGAMDTVGAVHPSFPAELVTLPVDMVTLELQFL